MCQNDKNTIHDGVIKTMHTYDKQSALYKYIHLILLTIYQL